MGNIGEICLKNLIIEQIKDEINPDKEQIQRIDNRLRKANLDELERVCNAFQRFGVNEIFEAVTIFEMIGGF